MVANNNNSIIIIIIIMLVEGGCCRDVLEGWGGCIVHSYLSNFCTKQQPMGNICTHQIYKEVP